MALKDSFQAVRGPRRRRIVIRQLAAIVVIAVVVAVAIVLIRGSSASKSTTVELPAATATGSGPTSHISFLERLILPPPERTTGPAAPRSIADLARRLPLERAVAQLFLVGMNGKDTSAPMFLELRRLDLGGIVLDSRNYDSPQQLAGLVAALSAAAKSAGHIPPWVMAEQDGGDYSQFGDLPPSHAPGDFHQPADAAAAMAQAATTLKALGLNGLLEPDLDVAGAGSALGTQALAGDPALVSDYGTRVVTACRRLRLFCAAKHFPGIGAADTTTDVAPAQVGLSMAQLMDRDVKPFAAAITAGVPGIVVGEGLYQPDDFVTPAAMSSKIIGGLLRNRLRYGGLAITDDLANPGVSAFAQVPDAAVAAINAGADMVYVSGGLGDQEAAYAAVLGAVRNGQIPEARARQALLRVLLAKRAYGLVQAGG
jgi:beta-N-acetylhexosaminidase